MQKKTKNRLLLTIIFITLVSLGVCIILYNLEQNITFFYPPSKLHEINTTNEIRVGGLVKPGSIIKISLNTIKFTITDNKQDLNILYQGILPALFRENQGIIAKGKLHGNLFVADELLAKHDENYMPPEVGYSM